MEDSFRQQMVMLTNEAQSVSQVSTPVILNGEGQKCSRPIEINTVSN